ncbi:MAG: hypothetical protein AMJ67_08690 [Betaproteobacteria bacterium SG8_41]|nr:MAG: hypothetical protein AMJ67_08690 [Betaproteobacteria bacterium SG8_41]
MALVDVRSQYLLHVVGRKLEIGDFDRGAQAGDRRNGCIAPAATGEVRAHVNGDFGFRHRFGPVPDGDGCARTHQGALQ